MAAANAPPRPASAAPVTAKAHFLLPDTYMNRSGEAVREAASFFKIPCAETLVVHDELELPLGEAAFKEGGGLGGHNGLRSVRDCLGSADFRRLRIGIGRPGGRKNAGDDISAWVLSPFTAEEEALLAGVLDVCASALETVLLSGPAPFAGLFFIALNRVIAPAFYARGDTASPAAAGAASFAVNIALAAALAGPMRGGGIALALSVSGAVNTLLLFVFLRRKADNRVAGLLPGAARYFCKITAFSAAASVPLLVFERFAAPLIAGAGGGGRLVSAALPLLCGLLLFAGTGVLLLAVSRDKHLKALTRQ